MIGIAAATLGKTGVVASDLVITQSDIKIISTNVDGIKSDLIISQSDIKIVSTNIDGIKSDLIISQSDIKIISGNIDAEIVKTTTIASDLVISQSDIKIISVNVDGIKSDLIITQSDVKAINAKVDGLGGSAEFEVIRGTTSSTTYVTLVEVTGAGKLYRILWHQTHVDTTGTIKITIDGFITELTLTGTISINAVVYNNTDSDTTAFVNIAPTEATNINIEYQDNMKIEYKISVGTQSTICKVWYGVN